MLPDREGEDSNSMAAHCLTTYSPLRCKKAALNADAAHRSERVWAGTAHGGGFPR
jgi:hypothetical protein